MSQNKKTINEAELKDIISEAVKKALKESAIYRDPTPFKDIYRAATELMDRYQDTQEDGYEPMDDDGGDIGGNIWRWAKKVAEDAEYYLQMHSSYQPINGGEDW